jgi:hypothetical protein
LESCPEPKESKAIITGAAVVRSNEFLLIDLNLSAQSVRVYIASLKAR